MLNPGIQSCKKCNSLSTVLTAYTATKRKNYRAIVRMDTLHLEKRVCSADAVTSPQRKLFLGLTPLKDIHIKMSAKRPLRISVEGNIGAGKSTFIQYFQNVEGIETYAEPLNWWRNLHGHNLLNLMYSDTVEWLKVFQSYVQLTRLRIQTAAPISPQTTTIQMFERSIQNNRYCFVECARDNGVLHGIDYAVLDEWYRWIRVHSDIHLDLIVYLRTSPQVIFERVQSRGRPEESAVTLAYLQQLHASHERWLMSNDERFNTTPVLVLNADRTADEILQEYRRNQQRILGATLNSRYSSVDDIQRERVKKALKLDC